MAITKARQLAELIANSLVDSDEISTGAVTTSKLADTLDFSSKTMVMADDQLSGDKIHGGTVSAFSSTGIDDNASSTAVTILSDGKVGIGYTSPNEKLHVNGHIEASSGFKLASHPVLDYTGFDGGYATRLGSTGTSTLNATQIFAGGSVQATFKGGNVGIGTTSPSKKFAVSSSGANGIEISPDDPTTSTNRILSYNRSTSSFTPLSIGADDIRFYIEDTERMRITSDGKIGIGTNDVSEARLSVIGLGNGNYNAIQIRSSSSTNGVKGGIVSFGQYDDASTSWTGLGGWDTGTARTIYMGGGGWGPQEATEFRVYTGSYDAGNGNAQTRLTVDSTGDVGIGTTGPSARLDVVSNSASGYVAEFRESNASNFGTILIDSPTDGESRPSYMDYATGGTVKWSTGLAYLDTARSFHIGTGSGTSNSKVTITTGGRVGIGTTSPTVDLEVSNSSNPFILIKNTTSGSGFYIKADNDGDAELQTAGGSNTIIMRTNGVARTKLTSNGALLLNSTGYVKTDAAQTLTIGDGNSSSAAGLDIIRGEPLSGGTGPYIRMYHGPDNSTQTEARISSVVGDLRIEADRNNVHGSSTIDYHIDGVFQFEMNNGGSFIAERGSSGAVIRLDNIGNGGVPNHYIELSSNLPGYSAGQYNCLKTSMNDLHFAAGNTYTGYISYNGGFTDISDVSLKENVVTIDGALSKVEQLQGRYFTWISENQSDDRQIGFIAQEVEAVIPELVSTSETGTKGVSYGKTTALLVEAIKEQQAIIDDLKARIEALEG